jgi:hypothetical protein
MSTVPCLLCDSPVKVSKEEWDSQEAPAAFCDDCVEHVDTGRIPWPMVNMIYLLRCQVSHLLGELTIVNGQIKNLFQAQQDLEQDLLKSKG